MKPTDSNASVARVLVVDQNRTERASLVEWLTAKGYRCEEADGAPAARERLDAGPVEVMILDVGLPDRTGIDLLRYAKERSAQTAVVVLSEAGQTGAVIEALGLGACAYAAKPPERELVLFHVAEALHRQELLLRNHQYSQQIKERAREQTLAVRRAHEETIYRLVAASLYRDEETGTHIRRSGLLSEVLAAAAGWSTAEAETLRMAAPMHDVGKIGIPDAILRKPGKLNIEEFEIMKTHTLIGAKMLAGSDVPILKMAQEIAMNHHERWDGNGYPAGRSSYDIPESARILTIVDVYDALTHDRVYRSALPEDEALEIMQQESGGHFDPFLLTLFFSHLDELRSLAQANPDEADNPRIEQSLVMRC